MHRFRSHSTVFQLWLGSFTLVASILGAIVAVALSIWTLIKLDPLLLRILLGMIGLVMLSGIVHFIMAFRVRCPLCHGKVLASQKCVRHRNARTSFGSHRLSVAKGVLTRGHFRCPYCGERSQCASRD